MKDGPNLIRALLMWSVVWALGCCTWCLNTDDISTSNFMVGLLALPCGYYLLFIAHLTVQEILDRWDSKIGRFWVSLSRRPKPPIPKWLILEVEKRSEIAGCAGLDHDLKQLYDARAKEVKEQIGWLRKIDLSESAPQVPKEIREILEEEIREAIEKAEDSIWTSDGYNVGSDMAAAVELAVAAVRRVPLSPSSSYHSRLVSELGFVLERWRREASDCYGYGSATIQTVIREVTLKNPKNSSSS